MKQIYDYFNGEFKLDSISLAEQKEFFEEAANKLKVPLFKLRDIHKETALLLSVEQMLHFGAIVVENKENKLAIALKNPLDKTHQDTLRMLFRDFLIEFGLIAKEDFKEAILWLKGQERLKEILEQIPYEITKDSKGEHSSILELVKLVLQEAVYKRASDVHFEKDFESLRIRFRID